MNYKIGQQFLMKSHFNLFTLISIPPEYKWYVLSWKDIDNDIHHTYQSKISMDLDFTLVNTIKTILPLP